MGKGQATAIGAIFFTMIVIMAIGFMFWTFRQYQRYQDAITAANKRAEEKRAEEVSIASPSYWIKYRYENPTCSVLIGNEVASDGLVGVESAYTSGDGGAAKVLLYDKFPSGYDGWTFVDESGGVLQSQWVGSGGYEGDGFISIRAAGATAGTYRGYLYKELSYESGAAESFTFSVVLASSKSSGGGTWIVEATVTRPSGGSILVLNSTVGDTGGVWSVRSSRVGDFFSEAGTYTVTISVTLDVNNTYTGYLGIDEVRLSAYYPSTPYVPAPYATVVEVGWNTTFNPLGAEVNLSIRYNASGVHQWIYAYDSIGGLWTLVDDSIIGSTSTLAFYVNMSGELGGRLGNETRILVLAGYYAPFRADIYGAVLLASTVDSRLRVNIANSGPVEVRLISIWLINSTTRFRVPLSVPLSPGESRTVVLNYSVTPNTTYLIKAVTDRGNIFATYLRAPISVGVVQPPPPPPAEYTVAVKVVDAENYALQGYPVTISPPTTTLYTDSSGYANFTVEEGSYVLSIATEYEGRSFIRWSDGVTDSSRSITVSGDSSYEAIYKSKTVIVELTYDGSRIRGRLLSEHDNPLGGKTVKLYYYDGTWNYIGSDATNSNGRFSRAWSYVSGASKIRAVFEGDGEYMGSSAEITISVHTSILNVDSSPIKMVRVHYSGDFNGWDYTPFSLEKTVVQGSSTFTVTLTAPHFVIRGGLIYIFNYWVVDGNRYYSTQVSVTVPDNSEVSATAYYRIFWWP